MQPHNIVQGVGGKLVSLGRDINRDGNLDGNEIEHSYATCNGRWRKWN